MRRFRDCAAARGRLSHLQLERPSFWRGLVPASSAVVRGSCCLLEPSPLPSACQDLLGEN